RDLVVIPVVVGGATMPGEADLPQPLRPLARLNAAYLTPQGWPDDVNRLVGVLEKVVGPATHGTGPVDGGGWGAAKAVVAVIVVAVFIVAGVLIFKAVSGDGPGPTPTSTNFPTNFP